MCEGLQKDYNLEMQRMIDSGAVKELEAAEMKSYDGGMHYMPHFAVLNPE